MPWENAVSAAKLGDLGALGVWLVQSFVLVISGLSVQTPAGFQSRSSALGGLIAPETETETALWALSVCVVCGSSVW